MATLIKKAGVREATGDVNVGRDFYAALDERVAALVDAAVDRARQNGRKTVKARDA